MIRIFRLFIAAVLVCVGVFSLYSCSTLRSAAVTNMIVNEDGSGQRIISCFITRDDIAGKTTCGESGIDSFLNENCPEEMTFSKTASPPGVKYDFCIDYQSPQEYEHKINSILVKSPQLTFSVPDNIFSKGVSLKENYTSEDLMKWFYDGMNSKGNINAGDYLWTYEDNYVTYEGEKQETGSQLEALRLSYEPLNKITIETNLKGENQPLERSVAFNIPDETVNRVGYTLKDYMNTLVPEGASGEWHSAKNGQIFKVSFTATGIEDLQTKMNRVLDSNQNRAEITLRSSTTLNSNESFIENLNCSSFPSNRNGKAFVEYNFKPESSRGIREAKKYEDNQWVDISDRLENGGLYFSEDADILKISLTQGTRHPVTDLMIDTKILGSGNFQRDIVLSFEKINEYDNMQKAKAYFDNFKTDAISVSLHDNRCIISLSGSQDRINSAQKELFGEGNSVSVAVDNSFNFYNNDSVTDEINLSKFLNDVGYKGKVEYSFTSFKNLYDYTVRENNGSPAAYRADSKQISSVLPESGIMTITSNSRTLNSAFALTMIIVIQLIIAMLILLTYVLVQNNKAPVTNKPDAIPDFLYSGYICPNCHMPLYQGMNYCSSCGQKIAQPKNI